MKYLFASLLIAALPLTVLAQAPAKPAAKAAAGKPVPVAKVPPGTRRQAIEEATPLEEPDPNIKLTEADIEVARKVYVGEIPCELGASVKITPLKREGFFLVVVKQNRFRMHPVESRTGAIRLEDPVRGAMWLQLGNKSMLMSQKLGIRLADECQSPAQVTYAESLKGKPPINILEPTPIAQPAPVTPAAAALAPAEPAAPAAVAAPATAVAPEAAAAPAAAATPETPTAPAPEAAPAIPTTDPAAPPPAR